MDSATYVGLHVHKATVSVAIAEGRRREVRERAVRMVLEHRCDHYSQWATIVSIAAKIGCSAQMLNEWTKKADIDSGRKPGLTTHMRLSERPSNCAKPTRSCARRARILPRRNSTADGSHD